MITETSRHNRASKRLLFAVLIALGLLALSASTGNAGGPRPSPTARASIIGGEAAAPGTFPWMAFLIDVRDQEVGSCSGTVVAPNLILTAGHCAVDLATGVTREATGYRVITGAVTLLAPERQLTRVSRVLVYPHFTLTGAFAGWGDAALLELSTPTTAPLIALASSANAKRLRVGTHALIAGWGETEYGQKPGPQLMWAKTIVQGRKCDGEIYIYVMGQICTLDPPTFASGTCNGDSGGPLLAAGPGGSGLLEIGITNSGFERCTTKLPSIYTRADLISPWVDRWIAALDPTQSARPRRAPSVPALDNPMAEIDTRQALLEALGEPFKRRFGYDISCRPVDSIKRHCVAFWYFRAKLYRGSVMISLLGGSETSWDAMYTTEWVTDHCWFHTDREHCTVHKLGGSRSAAPYSTP